MADVKLNGHHRVTLEKIFEHPVSHNIQWHDVLSLVENVATVSEGHDGRYKVTLGDETETFDAPKGHDIDEQTVVDLRRMFKAAGITPHLTAAHTRPARAWQHGGMELKVVRYEIADRVATITLDRPERLNSWTGRMHSEYRWALAEADGNPAVRVIVVTGAGRGFCAGADSRALAGHVERGGYDPGTGDDLAVPGGPADPRFDADFAYHFALSKPVIAAINGPAAGVGLVLACYCDLRFAAAGAKLTTAHGRLGLPAEYGLSWLLPRLIGLTRANDLLLSSRVVLAEEAAAMGLVNEVVPPGQLMDRVAEYAGLLASTVSPASLRQTRDQIYTDLHGDVVSSIRRSQQLLEEMVTGPDFAEGVAALGDKRAPRFADPPAGRRSSAREGELRG